MVEQTAVITPAAVKTKTRIAGILLLVAIAAALVAGVLPRLQHKAVLVADANGLATERLPVHVVAVKAGETKSEITLPGSMQAIVEAPIYARTSGYIKRRLVDIGDKVRTGQTLAEIDAPEVDQQLLQARATVAHSQSALGQAKASLVEAQAKMKLAKATLARWTTLAERGVVSQQEKDQKQSDSESAAAEVDALQSNVSAAEADVAAQQANVRRLEDMTSFKEVRAPFNGVITARHVDVGNLINEGSDSSQQELYHMARTDELRIMVGVPQAYSELIHVGDPAAVRVGELGQRDFPGKIVRTADALDPNSRTLLTEIHIPNANHLLFPGMFSSVRFRLQQQAPSMIVPGDVLMVDAQGTRAAVVDENHVVHFTTLTIGRDLGSTVEVLSGLYPGQHVVVNPADTLADGATVDVLNK